MATTEELAQFLKDQAPAIKEMQAKIYNLTHHLCLMQKIMENTILKPGEYNARWDSYQDFEVGRIDPKTGIMPGSLRVSKYDC
jgi:hypothetical protein